MSDVFISHSSKDKEIADKVVSYLEERGVSCWIAPRNIVPGSEWAASINTAITATRVFLIIYSANSSQSKQVVREISLAESRKDVFIIPYKIDDTPLSGTFEYYLSAEHWITADVSKNSYNLEGLYNLIIGITGKNVQNITNNTFIDIDSVHIHSKSEGEPPKPENKKTGSRRPLIIAASAAAAVIAAAVIITAAVSCGKPQTAPVSSVSSQASYEKSVTDQSVSGMTWDSDGYEIIGTYTGEVNEKGRPHGKGKLTGSFTDKNKERIELSYEGGFKNGQFDGRKSSVTLSGRTKAGESYSSFYFSDFKDNLANDSKPFTKQVFTDYTREWDIPYVNGAVEGEGTLTVTFTDLSYDIRKKTVEGNWKNDKIHGNATVTTSYDKSAKEDKIVYVGEYENDQKTGKGVETRYDKNGDIIVRDGEWANDFFNGKGTVTVTNADENAEVKKLVSEGSYINNKMKGEGKITYYYASGAYLIEEGEFTDNSSYAGSQTFFDEENRVKYKAEGNFKDGELSSGTVTRYDNDGNVTEYKTIE